MVREGNTGVCQSAAKRMGHEANVGRRWPPDPRHLRRVGHRLHHQRDGLLGPHPEQTGTEIRRVIMDALRNYVPEGVYEAALRMLEAEARQGLEPEFGEDAR